MPDLNALTLAQITSTLAFLAIAVFVTGVAKAVATGTLLWTYLAQWVVAWLLPAIVVVVLAVGGRGIPAVDLPPSAIIGALFAAAGLSYVAAAVAAIAKNVGIDVSSWPFAERVTKADVAAGTPPAV